MKFATLLMPSSVYMRRIIFKHNTMGLVIPKKRNITWSMMLHGETFYRRHTALTPAAVSKINVKKIAFGNKEHNQLQCSKINIKKIAFDNKEHNQIQYSKINVKKIAFGNKEHQ